MKALIILIPVLTFYLVYTIRYTRAFKKNKLFGKRIKLIHYILFWAVPFLWILLIKNISKDIPGTAYYYRNRSWMEEQPNKPESSTGFDPY
jgi:hypothetical protein